MCFIVLRSQNVHPVCLKSQSEYNRGNFGKAIKLLDCLGIVQPSASMPGDCQAVLQFNNLACAHSAMGN